MNILVACEESQTVTIELRRLGHRAFSCDLMECSGGRPEWHIKQDVLQILNPRIQLGGLSHEYYGIKPFETMDGLMHFIHGKWDMIIAFPPCTYMTKAGARWMYKKAGEICEERLQKAMEAKRFFEEIYRADCDRIAIENPVPLKIVGLPRPSQKIQPYQFGHEFSKETCLWLKGLPELEPANVVGNFRPYVPSNTSGYSKGGGGSAGVAHDKITRSRTFHGIARAMAGQWAGPCEEEQYD